MKLDYLYWTLLVLFIVGSVCCLAYLFGLLVYNTVLFKLVLF